MVEDDQILIKISIFQLKNMASQIRPAGGEVVLGTDYAGAPNVNFDLGMPIREIEWMQKVGMTPM